jgi:hypothetical protein
VQSAANGSIEPIAEVPNSCCVRSQRDKCRASKIFDAVMQLENRTFQRTAAWIKRRFYGSQEKQTFTKDQMGYRPATPL